MINKFFKINTRISLQAILALILIWANFNISFAQTPADSPPQSLSSDNARNEYKSFSVKKYLTVTDNNPDKAKIGSQEQTYLNSTNPIAAFIIQIINLITLTAASLSFLAVVVGGFLMMTSAGNAGQVTKGKEILMKAAIGLILTLSAYFIVAFVQSLLFETAGK